MMTLALVLGTFFPELTQLTDEEGYALLFADQGDLEITLVFDSDQSLAGGLFSQDGSPTAYWAGYDGGAGYAPGGWADPRDEQASLHKWERDGVVLWTAVRKWDRRGYRDFLGRSWEHEELLLSLGWTSLDPADWRGAPGEFPPEPPGLNSQSLQTKFRLHEDTDGDGAIDRTRYRMATTWRRSGESLEAFLARHELFEQKMMDAGWVSYE